MSTRMVRTRPEAAILQPAIRRPETILDTKSKMPESFDPGALPKGKPRPTSMTKCLVW
jgi:hypothetical protein